MGRRNPTRYLCKYMQCFSLGLIVLSLSEYLSFCLWSALDRTNTLFVCFFAFLFDVNLNVNLMKHFSMFYWKMLNRIQTSVVQHLSACKLPSFNIQRSMIHRSAFLISTISKLLPFDIILVLNKCWSAVNQHQVYSHHEWHNCGWNIRYLPRFFLSCLYFSCWLYAKYTYDANVCKTEVWLPDLIPSQSVCRFQT